MPKSVIFSSADASEVPWGVRENATATGWVGSPLLRDAALAEIVDGCTVACKSYTFY